MTENWKKRSRFKNNKTAYYVNICQKRKDPGAKKD